VVSLADRRKQRGSMLDAENDDMLNKLKDDAEFLERDGAGKRNALEEIAEDPDFEDPDDGVGSGMRGNVGGNLAEIRESIDDEMEGSPMKKSLGQTIEPDQNMSYMIGNMSPDKVN